LNTKLKCLLLDDELTGLSYLKMLCEQIPELEVVKAFNSPLKFCAELSGLDYDLCILDIEMPEMNGLQVANLLNGRPVIFTTAYKEYAADAFDLNAVDYVCKPLTKVRLEKAIKKASILINNAKEKRDFFQLNTDKGKAIIYFNQIQYLYSSDVDSRDKIIFLQDGTTLTAKNYTFNTILKELPYMDFCQVNKREAISIKAVAFFTNEEIATKITLSSGKQLVIHLSVSYKKEFLKKIGA
jgi:DNA-binding LytR/AlgR family response regulator